jgi:hypothetical protein
MENKLSPLGAGYYGYVAGIFVSLAAFILVLNHQLAVVLAMAGCAAVVGVIVGALNFTSVSDSNVYVREDSLVANALVGFLLGGVVLGLLCGLAVSGELGKANPLGIDFAALIVVTFMVTSIPGCVFAGFLTSIMVRNWINNKLSAHKVQQ